MKKILILLSFILLSGCTVNYNLTYENNTFNEEATIITKNDELCNNELCKNYLNTFYTSNITTNYLDDPEELAENVNLEKYKFYEKNIFNDANNYNMNLRYNFENSSNYKQSFILHKLYNNIIVTDDKIIAYEINNVFESYPNLDNIVISFKTDKYIKETNSDELKDDIYYWYINKNNYENKRIEINFDKETNDKKTIIKDGLFTNTFIRYFLLIILLIILIIILVIYEKFKKSNK